MNRKRQLFNIHIINEMTSASFFLDRFCAYKVTNSERSNRIKDNSLNNFKDIDYDCINFVITKPVHESANKTACLFLHFLKTHGLKLGFDVS